MLCVGGNGRSAGFPIMVARPELRARFLKELVALLDRLQLQGVDYNWCAALARDTSTIVSRALREYPGYDFQRGYAANEAVERDYMGLGLLLKETRDMFGSGASARVLSAACLPPPPLPPPLPIHNTRSHPHPHSPPL